MGRKPSLVAQKAVHNECCLKERFPNLIRAAAGITFLGWFPQMGTAYGGRAELVGAGVSFYVLLIRTLPIVWFKGKKERIILIFYACPVAMHIVLPGTGKHSKAAV